MTKILVIDDELEICKQISLILSKQGYEVTYANSHKEFVEIEQRSFDYDVVLVDLWLKNSTKQGIDIIEYLKNKYKNLVIVSFSGHANIDNAIESVKAGANDFIEKPFETKKLLHIIQKNLLELKQKVTINNYRNQISFHSKINKIGFSENIENYFDKISKVLNPPANTEIGLNAAFQISFSQRACCTLSIVLHLMAVSEKRKPKSFNCPDERLGYSATCNIP